METESLVNPLHSSLRIFKTIQIEHGNSAEIGNRDRHVKNSSAPADHLPIVLSFYLAQISMSSKKTLPTQPLLFIRGSTRSTGQGKRNK